MPPHPPTRLIGNATVIAEAEWPAIRAAYSEPQRHYHTWHHILAVLAAAEEFAAEVQSPRGMYLACVYHDIVYDPGARDNEARSAAMMRNAADRGAIDARPADVEIALKLIETSGGEGHDSADGNIFWDIDRAILAVPPDAYRAYARNVRREFARFNWLAYGVGRARFLKSELVRPQIFRTPRYRADHEMNARANISDELRRLKIFEMIGRLVK